MGNPLMKRRSRWGLLCRRDLHFLPFKAFIIKIIHRKWSLQSSVEVWINNANNMPFLSYSAQLSVFKILCQCLRPKTRHDGISCGGMWENIPPVQLHRSTISAKARLSSSGGSQWPRAEQRLLLLMFPTFWLHLFPTLAHLGPYLLPPSSLCRPRGRTNREGESVYVCMCSFPLLYSG